MASKKPNSSLWTGKRSYKDLLIRKAEITDIEEIVESADKINKSLLKEGFDQWNYGYPNKETFETDIYDNTMYLLVTNKKIAGFVSINPMRNRKFFIADFEDKSENIRIVSRLSVVPEFQGKGFAGVLMEFAENKIRSEGFSSIRLGALNSYTKVVQFYKRRNYKIQGEMFVERTGHTYYLMEKILD